MGSNNYPSFTPTPCRGVSEGLSFITLGEFYVLDENMYNWNVGIRYVAAFNGIYIPRAYPLSPRRSTYVGEVYETRGM